MATRDLLVRFQGETDPSVTRSSNSTMNAIRGVGDAADEAAGRQERATGRIAGFWAGLTTKMIDLGLQAGQAVVGFLGDSVSEASDLSETMSKAEAIFGDQAGAMAAWGDQAANAFGLSKATALDSAAAFGDMFSQIGFAGGDAATMSQDVVQLAADLGSFNNLETSEVLDMISASMRGEYDSLQRVIPNINAARVETEALAMTGKTAASELTAQEKATATLAIITGDASRAAGDFGRTSEGAANQQKIFAAQVDDLQAKIGAVLLPVLSDTLGFITGRLMPGISEMADRVGPAFDSFVGWIGEAKTTFTEGWNNSPLPGILGALGDGIQTNVLPAWERLQDSIGGFRDKVAPIVTEISDFVQQKFSEWGPKIEEYTGEVTEIVGGAMDFVSSIITRVGDGISQFWDRWGGTILAVTGTVFDTIGRLIGNALDLIKGIFRTGTAIFRGDWDEAFQGINDITESITSAVGNTLRGLIDVIGNLFGVNNLTDKITGGFKAAISWINDKFIGGVNGVISKVGIDWSIPLIPGFAGGGYTGSGGVSEPAGIVHRGEVVWSQRDVSAWGGPGVVDAMRRWRGYEDGGIVGALAGAAGSVLDFVRDPGSVLGRLVDGIMGSAPGGLAGAFVQALRTLPKLIGDKLRSFIGDMFSGGRVNPGGGLLPTAGVISSPYGFRVGPFNGPELHDGVDIAAPFGTPVFAPLPGVVTQAGGAGGYGLMVTLDHGGFTTFYAHLATITAQIGQILAAGEVLGLVGSTGWSTGPHLHWGSSIGDPMSLLYDRGGWLQPGVSLVENRTGAPEAVLTGQQWAQLTARTSGGPVTVRIDDDQFERLVRATIEHLTVQQITDPAKSAQDQAREAVAAIFEALEEATA